MPDSLKDNENYSYAGRLTNGLISALERNLFTDVIIKVEQNDFPCHKVILSSMSPYFEGMFASGMKESSQSVIELHDLRSEWFESVLKYMYSGKVDLTKENVRDILQVGSFLQVLCLQELCEEFILNEILSLETCLSLWQMAPLYGCTYLAQQVKLFIVQHFKTIALNGDLSQLSEDELKAILSDEHINVSSECLVLEAALNWIRITKTDSTTAKNIFDCVRMDLIPAAEWELFNEKLKQSGDEGLCSLLNELRSVMLNVEKYNVSSRLRFYDRLQDVIIIYPAAGFVDMDDFNDDEIVLDPHCVSLRDRKLMNVAQCPFGPEETESVCFVGQDLYIAGVTANEVALCRFNGNTGIWQNCKNLGQVRTKFTLVSCGSCIYLIGGINENLLQTWTTVEEYDPETDEWCKKGDLICPVTEFSFVTTENAIYIYLGIWRRTLYTGNNSVRIISECVPDIQSFNCTTGHCQVIGHLPEEISSGPGNRHTFAFRRGTTVFIITPRGMVIKVSDFCRDPVVAGDVGELSPKDRLFHGIDTGTEVYLIGGRYFSSATPDVFMFDPHSVTVTKIYDLPLCSQVSTCTFGHIKTKFLQAFTPNGRESDDQI